MKSFIKTYRHLIALALVLTVAFTGSRLGILSPTVAVAIVGLWQLAFIATSKHRAGVFCMAGLSTSQLEEFEDIMESFKGYGDMFKQLKELSDSEGGLKKLKGINSVLDKFQADLKSLRRRGALSAENSGVRWIGNQPFVSEDCAKAITSVFVLDCARLGKALDNMVPDDTKRSGLVQLAAANLGMEVRTALSSSEIPLPIAYVPQIVELVFAYGTARQYATLFPLGSGTVKLPRLKAGEDEFGFFGTGTTGGLSQNITEKKVAAEPVTFDASKAGGLIRIPYELQEDTFVPIGQFLARYIARQFAKLEDRTLFLGDGTSAYGGITGVAKYCQTNTDYLLTLGAGKTKPSDVTLDDLRSLRTLANPAILANMSANGQTSAAYYLHPTFEPLLRSFNKYPNFIVFEYVNGKPMFDGFPVHWIGVSQANTKGAAPNAPLAFFGDLSYWYLGERGAVRVEISKEVFFATDEIAMRAIERIDVQALATDAVVTLMTAAQ